MATYPLVAIAISLTLTGLCCIGYKDFRLVRHRAWLDVMLYFMKLYCEAKAYRTTLNHHITYEKDNIQTHFQDHEQRGEAVAAAGQPLPEEQEVEE